MKQPLWASAGFTLALVVVLLGVATLALWRAVLYARMNVPPAARVQPDTALAVLLMIVSMLLVAGAIVLPLVLRHQAQKRLSR